MSDTRLRILNRLIPGAALVLRGHVATGMGLGLTFAASANTILVAVFLLPDDIALSARVIGLGAAAGSYWFAQWHLERLPETPDPAATKQRRAALSAAAAAIREGRGEDALAQLAAVERLAEKDLLVAYRIAQAQTLAGRAESAARAWQRVRRLDAAGIYKEETRRSEQLLRSPNSPASCPGDEVSQNVDPIAPGGR